MFDPVRATTIHFNVSSHPSSTLRDPRAASRPANWLDQLGHHWGFMGFTGCLELASNLICNTSRSQ